MQIFVRGSADAAARSSSSMQHRIGRAANADADWMPMTS